MTIQAEQRSQSAVPAAWQSMHSNYVFSENKVHEPKRFVTISIPEIRQQEFANNPDPISNEVVIEEAQAKAPSGDLVALKSIKAAIQETADALVEPTKAAPIEITRTDYLERLDHKDPQLKPLLESIKDRSEMGGSRILMFAGSEENAQLEPTIMKSALAYSQQSENKVLVIDADFFNAQLTRRMNRKAEFGLTDLVADEQQWRRAIYPTSSSGLEFLPVGKTRLSTVTKLDSVLREMISKLSQEYDLILVNVGDAHGESSQIWSEYANGSYLLVSMRDSNQTVAKSAVSSLNSFGARLLGCIVSEASE